MTPCASISAIGSVTFRAKADGGALGQLDRRGDSGRIRLHAVIFDPGNLFQFARLGSQRDRKTPGLAVRGQTGLEHRFGG